MRLVTPRRRCAAVRQSGPSSAAVNVINQRAFSTQNIACWKLEAFRFTDPQFSDFLFIFIFIVLLSCANIICSRFEWQTNKTVSFCFTLRQFGTIWLVAVASGLRKKGAKLQQLPVLSGVLELSRINIYWKVRILTNVSPKRRHKKYYLCIPVKAICFALSAGAWAAHSNWQPADRIREIWKKYPPVNFKVKKIRNIWYLIYISQYALLHQKKKINSYIYKNWFRNLCVSASAIYYNYVKVIYKSEICFMHDLVCC